MSTNGLLKVRYICMLTQYPVIACKEHDGHELVMSVSTRDIAPMTLHYYTPSR